MISFFLVSKRCFGLLNVLSTLRDSFLAIVRKAAEHRRTPQRKRIWWRLISRPRLGVRRCSAAIKIERRCSPEPNAPVCRHGIHEDSRAPNRGNRVA